MNFFYEVNIAWHLMFIEVVKTTSKSQTYYKPPSYHGLCKNLQKQSKVDASKLIVERIQNSIHKYGTTICFDCWDNVAKCWFLNVTFACPNGNVFIGVIDTIREHKDAQVLHINVLVGYIETIRVDNIIQICTNNISNMQNVINLLICHFSNLYFQVCAIHCLDLLLENWREKPWVKQIVKRVKIIVSFIRQHHAPLAIFCHYKNNLSLKTPLRHNLQPIS